MSKILEKQGKELIECIKEMEMREEHRISRLQKLTAAPNEKVQSFRFQHIVFLNQSIFFT